jgi:hypothetical protein
LTGPNQRSVNGKAQRKFDARQEDIGLWVEWCWIRVIGDGIAKGRLRPSPFWNRMEWQGPRKVSIDDGRDAAQEREDLFNGLITRQNHYGNRSLNWKRETDQSLVEDEYIIAKCIERSKRFNIPLDTLLSRYGFGRNTPAQQQPQQQQKPQQTETQPTPQPEPAKKETPKK